MEISLIKDRHSNDMVAVSLDVDGVGNEKALFFTTDSWVQNAISSPTIMIKE